MEPGDSDEQIVVIDIQNGVGVSLPGRLEGNPDKVLSKDVGEDRRSEGAVLVEHLVDDVLSGEQSH
jgi:hypothetical protein